MLSSSIIIIIRRHCDRLFIYKTSFAAKNYLINNNYFLINNNMFSTDNNTDNQIMNRIDIAKRSAAYECGSRHIEDGMRIGVGSGSTAKHLVDYIAERVRDGYLKDIQCVPTSFMTRQWLIDAKVPVSDLEHTPELDICIDGADEIDPILNCIKGGGGCLAQEKIVQSCSKRFMLIADMDKCSTQLGSKYAIIPIEILPIAHRPIKLRIEREKGGSCELRMATRKLGPVITDNGNYIIDWNFPKDRIYENDWIALNTALIAIPGVVETGLFIDVAECAFIGHTDGHVVELKSPTKPV